jgi:hypothetical protein
VRASTIFTNLTSFLPRVQSTAHFIEGTKRILYYYYYYIFFVALAALPLAINCFDFRSRTSLTAPLFRICKNRAKIRHYNTLHIIGEIMHALRRFHGFIVSPPLPPRPNQKPPCRLLPFPNPRASSFYNAAADFAHFDACTTYNFGHQWYCSCPRAYCLVEFHAAIGAERG